MKKKLCCKRRRLTCWNVTATTFFTSITIILTSRHITVKALSGKATFNILKTFQGSAEGTKHPFTRINYVVL